jgi:phosphodiesterase/alkaline phosphatase D-like protein
VPPGPGVGESFDFRFDGFPFFMLDTRSARGVRTVAGLATASLFTEATLTALKEWLTAQPRGIPKFIVTPSMLLPRHRRAIQHAPAGGGLDASNLSALHSDGWDGYPSTLSAVLGFIAESKIPHVVFLSGDEHRGCVASIELHDASGTHVLARLHSLHTTAAYAPFPFANSLDSDYTLSETIEFRYGAAKYQCVVRAKLPQTGDGALLLRPRKENGTWKLDYEYADARGTIEI